jgi:hypothetical protein
VLVYGDVPPMGLLWRNGLAMGVWRAGEKLAAFVPNQKNADTSRVGAVPFDF